jgi:hypothetical protein
VDQPLDLAGRPDAGVVVTDLVDAAAADAGHQFADILELGALLP